MNQPSGKGQQPSTTANISTVAAATISHTMPWRVCAVVNKDADNLLVRAGGDSTAPAADDPDAYDDIVPAGTTKWFWITTDRLSIYNTGAGTATYGTNFSVKYWL